LTTMDKGRTNSVFFIYFFYAVSCSFQHYCLAVVLAGGGSSIGCQRTNGDKRKSSVFGIVSNAICNGGDSDSSSSSTIGGGDDGSLRRLSSSSYTRFGRFSLSRETNNNSDDTIVSIRNDYTHITDIPKSSPSRRQSRRRRLTAENSLVTNSVLTSTTKTDLTPSLSQSTQMNNNSNDYDDQYAMTQPIIPLSVLLDEQTGKEFSDPNMIDRLVLSGLEMIDGRNDNNWIEWKMHDTTRKLLRDNKNSELSILEQGEVMVYIGKAKMEGHGSKLPIIKTKSILPLSSDEMVDLLMDSSKVQIYNKLSVGRTDVQTLGLGDETTKVVCNLTKPPMAKSNMVSCTMMHSRTLGSEGTSSSPPRCRLVVSRAAPGMLDIKHIDMPRNDILLGVNLLEDIGPNECIMTAVTHVYSPALPTILAKKLGVSSAINFVKDIRNSCKIVAG